MNQSKALRAAIGRWPAMRWWTGTREFFKYHGVWAVGVRLLRNLSIKHKILSVVLLAALPLAPMSAHMITEQSHIVDDAERRIAGARLAIAIERLADELEHTALQLERGQPIDREVLARAGLQLRQARGPAELEGLVVTTGWEAVEPALARLDVGIALTPQGMVEALNLARSSLANLREQTVHKAGFLLTSDATLLSQADRAYKQLPRTGDALWSLKVALRELAEVAAPKEPGAHFVSPALIKAVGRAELLAVAASQLTKPLGSAGLNDGIAPIAAELDALQGYAQTAKAALLDDGVLAESERQLLQAQGELAASSINKMQQRLLLALIDSYQHMKDESRHMRLLVIGGTLLSLGMAMYLFYAFYLVMRGGLVTLTEQARRMATGDLTVRRRPHGGDEVAETMKAVSLSIERLGELLSQVRYGSSSVSQAAQQIANGNVDLRTRNHRTSDALQKVVDGVARYGEQLEACSVQVERVVTTVQALRLQSARSRRQMDLLTGTLTQVRKHSQEITDAVSLIDNVAFRTNILALNASVEASKAGEAGKGFAVVAQEVRSLALRSAEAARRIGSIVAASSTHVEQSAQLAEDTGRGIAESDSHIDLIHGAMGDVSSLTSDGQKESAAILDEVRALRETTEKNLGLVEQLANASHSLRSHGERLTHRLTHFKLS